MKSIIKILKQYSIALIALVIVGYLSFMDVGGIPTSKFFAIKRSDIIIHFLMYSFLSFVFFLERYFRDNKSLDTKTPWAFLVVLISIGALIEFLQPVLSNRSREFFDFVANSSGVFWGYYLHRLAVRLLKRQE